MRYVVGWSTAVQFLRSEHVHAVRLERRIGLPLGADLSISYPPSGVT